MPKCAASQGLNRVFRIGTAQISAQRGQFTPLTERSIVKKVHKAKLRHLDDGIPPQELALSRLEKADTRPFPTEIL
jgi:hypothetical protein